MQRISRLLATLATMFLVIIFCLALSGQKRSVVDINSASIPELERLPGVNAPLAHLIVLKRPFAKAEDLKAVGMSDSTIKTIMPLVIFGRAPGEKLAPRPAGPVASLSDRGNGSLLSQHANASPAFVTLRLADLCSTAWNQEKPAQVVKSHDKDSIAVCLPKLWFAADGELSSAGQTGFTTFVDGYLKNDSGEKISIVRYASANSSFSMDTRDTHSRNSVQILAHRLGERGLNVTAFPEQIHPNAKTPNDGQMIRNAYTVQPLNSDAFVPSPKKVTLVIPPLAAENSKTLEKLAPPDSLCIIFGIH